jgi:hypothetical protein
MDFFLGCLHYKLKLYIAEQLVPPHTQILGEKYIDPHFYQECCALDDTYVRMVYGGKGRSLKLTHPRGNHCDLLQLALQAVALHYFLL